MNEIIEEVLLMVKKSKGIKTLLSVLIITALVISMQIVGYGISTTVYLSDVQWERASIGWGNIHINRSVGNNPITLNGVKYPKGIGTHANSDITYNLGGVCATFDADVGVDDEMTGYSTVVFQVFLDGVIAYDSGTMNPGTATRSISLNVTGVQKLRLIVTDAGDGNNSDHVDWANARVSVNSGYTFPVLPPADIGDVNNPKGDYYDYTLNWYPERPYIRDYTQMPITKIYLARKDPSNPSNATIVYMTFEQALDAIIKLDKLMNGAPKIVYLVGWQYQGHDSKYPAWAQVNSALKRAADATALDSLKWLMNEAFKYNTVVSLHINMIDSFQDSPLWSTYNSNNIVAKETDGTLIPGETFDGQVSYQNDYKKEWDMGYAKQRIDGLLSMLPIQTAGTIHIDAFHSAAPSHWDRPISPLNGYTLTEQQYTQRRIMRYWRQQGVDVTAEYTSMSTLKPDPFYGLQAGSWHSGIGAEIPSYLSVDTPLEPIEDQIKYNDWNGVRSTVFTRFVPWYYRNNTSKEIGFESHEDGNGNYFYPALWKDQAIIAYSTNGYTSKTWTMPPGWSTVTQADLYTVSANGNTYVSSVSISNNQITFSMSAGQALLIVPSNSTVRPSQVQVNLSSYFNQDGFSYDTNRADGAFGEDNFATYSADLVATNPTYDGTTYSFGPMANGSMNEIKGAGQVINLTQGQYTSIRMLGAATGGDQTGTFTVTYTDNSTS
ncbi:MAG: hypothetical protein FIA99_12475, partial [Ruminiclostridium sp.]|nr:hypothetical protein [Ruminiclostridium sp.]